MREVEKGPRPARMRAVAVPKWGRRLAIAAGLGLVIMVVGVTLLPAGRARASVLILGAPVVPFSLMFLLDRAPRLFAERAAARRARRVWTGPLADASKRAKPVVLVGRLEPTTAILAPSGTECAAWLRRSEWEGKIVDRSNIAGAVLKSERHGDLPLEEGSWRLQNPFDGMHEEGEATIAIGEEVVVRARVQSFDVRGEGYRDSAVRYRLRAGGLISPRRRRFSRVVISKVGGLAGGAIVAGCTFGVALVIEAATAPTPTATRRDPPAPAAPTARACDERRRCGEGLVCDVETLKCVKSIEGRLAEGERCTRRGDCEQGLRCRPDVTANGAPEVCARACGADTDCKASERCVPCLMAGQKRDGLGDCRPAAALTGPVGVVCNMVHDRTDK